MSAATPTCCGRVGTQMPAWAPRRNARCGNYACHQADVRIRERIVLLPLCGLHYGVLVRSPDPAVLARQWAPNEGDRT